MLKVIIVSLITTLIGCLFHFTYALSHKNKIVAVFSAVNESTWEHIKMGISALILVSMAALLNYPLGNVIVASAFSFLIFIVVVPILFYAILAIMGRHNVVASILEFAFSIFVAILCFDTFVQQEYTSLTLTISIIILALVLVAWGLFTFFPPKIFLFRDTTNNKYGLAAHKKKHHH